VTTALLQPQLELLDQRFPERLVPVDAAGTQVAVRECGPREGSSALVLLHGISSGAASWLHAVLPLAGTQRVVAWDAPGYGRSTPLAASAPRTSDYAQRLDETLRALGVQRCVLVGHSLGALMACAYARLERTVDRLVLISPARGYAASPEQAERVRRERTEALQAKGVAGLAEGIAQRLLSPQASPAAREWVRWNTARLHPPGYLQAVEMLCGSELGSLPATLSVEVHCGEADVVTPPATCAQAATALGASFRTIANAGHASPVEQPEAVAALLRAALQAGGER
jgi:pimeloyl-ACP methyl ester carboxylesterase